MGASEYTDDEYETLQTSKREIAGNEEPARIVDVRVGASTARLKLEFDWKEGSEIAEFDLDSERDVMELKTLARGLGYDYDHLPYLEGETITAVYLDGEWVPAATLPDAEGDVLGDASTGRPDPLSRAYRVATRRVGDLSTNKLLIAVIVFKKLLIASAIVYLLVA